MAFLNNLRELSLNLSSNYSSTNFFNSSFNSGASKGRPERDLLIVPPGFFHL